MNTAAFWGLNSELAILHHNAFPFSTKESHHIRHLTILHGAMFLIGISPSATPHASEISSYTLEHLIPGLRCSCREDFASLVSLNRLSILYLSTEDYLEYGFSLFQRSWLFL